MPKSRLGREWLKTAWLKNGMAEKTWLKLSQPWRKLSQPWLEGWSRHCCEVAWLVVEGWILPARSAMAGDPTMLPTAWLQKARGWDQKA